MEKQYIASISYGKDSLAMLHVITDVLQWPLDRIITADVWATPTIPAELPPMVEFKAKADVIIKERWGIEVEHVSVGHSYEEEFYKKKGKRSVRPDTIYGFPMQINPWCNWHLKLPALERVQKICGQGVAYIGIAVDEPERIAKVKEGQMLPLVEANWTEEMCRDWCKSNDLLSPTYKTSSRGGCWFCHCQPLNQLRLLRRNYPELWDILLRWDSDSPVPFKSDGQTVHDIDRRLQWEDEGYMPTQKSFRWEDVEYPQMNIYQFIKPEPLHSFEKETKDD